MAATGDVTVEAEAVHLERLLSSESALSPLHSPSGCDGVLCACSDQRHRDGPSSSSSLRRVAVIGAGASGLAALKELRSAGLDAHAWERASNVGGVWGAVSVHAYASLTTNSAAAMTAYSDFAPLRTRNGTYASHSEISAYLEAYARQHALHAHITLGATVTAIAKARGGGYSVRWRDRDGCDAEMTVDAVVVCGGQFAVPRHAERSDSNGAVRVMHSVEYRSPEALPGGGALRVVVVGVGNSAVDLAVDLAQAPSQRIARIELCARSGCRAVPLDCDARGEWPLDAALFRRGQARGERRALFLARSARLQPSLEALGLSPPKPSLDRAHVTLVKRPDALLGALRSGRVVLRAQTLAANAICDGRAAVRWADGSESACDVLIKCTGYVHNWAYLAAELRPVASDASAWTAPGLGELVGLYRHVLHPLYTTLAFLGQVESQGSTFAVAEMQARWLSALWTRQLSAAAPLPCLAERQLSVRAYVARCWRERLPFPMFVDWLAYMDAFAADLGCLPRADMWPPDRWPLLHALLSHGTVYPSVYRLTGPQPWPDASRYLTDLARQDLLRPMMAVTGNSGKL